MKRYVLATAFCLSAIGPVAATAPRLTPTPTPATVDACRGWASSQDDDARFMWGTLPNGSGTEQVGELRLTLFCLGDPKPEIADFGASAGADAAYCKRHPGVAICKSR